MKLRIWTVLFLVIVVCVSTGMLNVVYVHTDPIVRKNERTKIQRSVLEVFDIPYGRTGISDTFERHIETQVLEQAVSLSMEGKSLYRYETGGLAFEISGPGFWGQISALIALEPDLETIRGLKILKHVETPGLGGRVAESWFLSQFKGKRVTPELKIVSYRKSEGPNEVDAISGATQTSKAFERIINSNIEAFRRNIGK
jgi:Na+-transporting NADH:ubiquinone oxidoreductase subunit C